MHKVYYAPVTEFESGWGSRPDGYLITLDKDLGDKYATKEKGKIWCMDDGSEFSIKDGEWKLGVVADDTVIEKINSHSHKTAWESKLPEWVEV